MRWSSARLPAACTGATRPNGYTSEPYYTRGLSDGYARNGPHTPLAPGMMMLRLDRCDERLVIRTVDRLFAIGV